MTLKANIFHRTVSKAGCLAFQTKTNAFQSFWHSHAEHELVYIESGHGDIQYGNIITPYQQGDILLLGPWVPHEFKEQSQDHSSISFLFTDKFLSIDLFQCDTSKKIMNLLRTSIFGIHCNLTKNEGFQQQIQSSINCASDIENTIALFYLMKEISNTDYQYLHNYLNKDSNTRFHKKYVQLQNILAYINTNLSEKLDLQKVARNFYISKSYLSKLFSDFLQVSFLTYIVNQRLDYACRLLTSSTRSITEISELSGFASQSSFNRNFLKNYRVSPRTYREQNSFTPHHH